MKVSVAQVVSGQAAETSDLVSLLVGDRSSHFASLLALNGTERDATQGIDEGPGKQGRRWKQKYDNDGTTPVHGGGGSAAASNPVGAQAISDIAIMPWQLESDGFRASSDAGMVTRAPSLTETTNETASMIRTHPVVANVQSIGASRLDLPQIPNKSASNLTSAQNLADESPKGRIRGQGINMESVVPSPTDRGMPFTVSEPSSVTSAPDEPSTCLVDTDASTLISVIYSDPTVSEPPVPVGYAASNREVKPGAGKDNSTVGLVEQLTDSSPENKAGATSSAPSQAGVDFVSSSPTVADNRSQDNASDPHRSAPDAKQTLTDARFPTPQKLQGDALGVANPGTMLHGHSAVMNSNRAESIRESISNTQKELTSPRATDASVMRLLGSAMRGDLRLGLQTEAFGHVTIQANAQGGQLSAQLSLENAKESATIAAHLPGVEQKIVQQHGLTASVRLAGGFGGAGAGSTGHERSGSGQRDPRPHRATQSWRIEHDSSNENREVEPVFIGNKHFASSRLDVTV